MVIRYRAWDKHVKKIRKVTEIHFDDSLIYLKANNGKGYYCSFSDIELMQSTGLLNCETEDGKNVEGWEGDIADIGWSEQTGEFNSHRIILKSPFDYSTDEARWLIHAEYIIIRGNIYENPELLEQTHEN
ncbi:YopX family protein [Enterococcus gallinarum]|uniref:YopX family protein n=1 Tax=Enterococcus gallinarum TaxID=1353 RepID=UPI0018AB1D18|nr:YopX family protein [Enterococcus gallinarum]